MAMNISSNYGGYCANTILAAGQGRAQSPGIGRDVSKNSKDTIQEYYENLCKKFPRISFNRKGGIMSSSKNKIVLNLSEDCLKKMAGNPDFAKEIENTISGIPAAHNWVYGKAKSDGIELHGFAVRINSDGSMQCSCEGSSTRMGTTGPSKGMTSTKKQKNERMEKGKKWFKER